MAASQGDVTRMCFGPGDVVFLDAPYEGTTGYEAVLSRDEVLMLGERFASAGAVVGISEAEPLPLSGWHHLDLTPHGSGKPEWLTLSRAPVWAPAVQMSLV